MAVASIGQSRVTFRSFTHHVYSDAGGNPNAKNIHSQTLITSLSTPRKHLASPFIPRQLCRISCFPVSTDPSALPKASASSQTPWKELLPPQSSPRAGGLLVPGDAK